MGKVKEMFTEIEETWKTILDAETAEMRKKYPLITAISARTMALEQAIPKLIAETMKQGETKNDNDAKSNKSKRKTTRKKTTSGKSVRIARRTPGVVGN